MEEFRGLYSVVEAWRSLTDGDKAEVAGPLAEVLMMADDYMSQIEGETAQNVAAVADVQIEHARGLFHKYNVTRVDNMDLNGGKHHGCPLFVLDLRHDSHARTAAMRYAESVAVEEPVLAHDLITLVHKEEPILPGGDLVDVGTAPVFSPNLAEVPMLAEYHCGQTDPHHGHAWRMMDMPATEFDSNNPGSVYGQPTTSHREVWCVGSHG